MPKQKKNSGSRNKNSKSENPKQVVPTGLPNVDLLADLSDDHCDLAAYLTAVSEYVRKSDTLDASRKKAAQIRLSNALARAFVRDLRVELPGLKNVAIGETKVSGALRTVNADVSESHKLDGLRLAVELKPVNLAVGRAIWNRFGDIRTFAVNLHLKFPFCVVGGVLVIPTYELVGTAESVKALEEEAELSPEGSEETEGLETRSADQVQPSLGTARKSTIHLIQKAVARLTRAGGRKTEGDAPHLLEGIAVVVYNPDEDTIDLQTPPPSSGLRWEEFVKTIAAAYQARFED